MSTPSISYLALDADNDPVFDPAYVLTGTQAVAQNILTRLRLWYGEWWENRQLGLPALQSILAQGASSQAQTTMALAIQTQIQQTPYVTSVLDIQIQFKDGNFAFACKVQTAFGIVTVASQFNMSAAT